VREITRRNLGHRVQDVTDELRLYVNGWLNYVGISHTYTGVTELAEWVRRRVRLYYWKQWKQPRTRRRHLLALGIPRDEVHMATRSRKGYWRMSANSILPAAGEASPFGRAACPDQPLVARMRLREDATAAHARRPDVSRRSPKGEDGHAHVMDCSSLRAKRPCLTGTAVGRPAHAVVWHRWLADNLSQSPGADWVRFPVSG